MELIVQEKIPDGNQYQLPDTWMKTHWGEVKLHPVRLSILFLGGLERVSCMYSQTGRCLLSLLWSQVHPCPCLSPRVCDAA